MNEGLFTAYQSLPAWKRLMERIGESGCTALMWMNAVSYTQLSRPQKLQE